MLAAVQHRGNARLGGDVPGLRTGRFAAMASLVLALGAGPALAAEPPTGPEAQPDAEVSEPSPAEPDEVVAPDEPDPEYDEDDARDVGEAPKPPRIDGTYVGGTVFGGLGLVRVNDFATDGPFASFGATASVGQMVFPWLGLGLHGGGGGGVRSQDGARQTLGQGFLGIEFKFVPLPKRLPLSFRTSFAFGAGAVRQAGVNARSGYGGAEFGAAVRYELFPWAKRRRQFRGGGFGFGPELGWQGFTPAASGRPMSNTLYLALATTFYFGS
ncbi:MAG: hypothetical protein K0V04_04070 [Deltaproteobacteria bacterium]|nr:hypothetical protein [Deltaproteobacteria bacterium]